MLSPVERVTRACQAASWRLALVALLAASACADGVASPTERDIHSAAPSRDIPPGPYTAGQSYYGRNGYIEYIAGNAPVIYTAPHGGSLAPDEIPDRTAGACGGSATTATDLNTADLVVAMQQRHRVRFGTYPHIIINRLARRKLDANRLPLEAACGDPEAGIALEEWHAFIDVAKRAVLRTTGRGWYMDMHGHGHSIQRLELGYLLTASQLDRPDATLDDVGAYQDTASIRTISEWSPLSFSALLRGPASLGTLYANNGFPAVPSAPDPSPGSDPYFTGGDNTRRHTCGAEATLYGGTTGGMICGVQVEANFSGVRDNAVNRDRFADATATVLREYLATHWGIDLAAPPAPIALSAVGAKVTGVVRVRLDWSGAAGPAVDVYRNGARVATVPNAGSFADVIGRVPGTQQHRVCQANTTICSNQTSVAF